MTDDQDKDHPEAQAKEKSIAERQAEQILKDDIENIVLEDTRLKNLELMAERDARDPNIYGSQLTVDVAKLMAQDARVRSLAEKSRADAARLRQTIDDKVPPLNADHDRAMADTADSLERYDRLMEEQEARDEAARILEEERQRALQNAQRREAARNALTMQFLYEHNTGAYFDKNSRALIMKEMETSITAPRDHSRDGAKAIVQLAEAKGWQAIEVKGTKDFRRDVWMQASLKGMPVRGYEPTEKDKAALAREVARSSENQIREDRAVSRDQSIEDRFTVAKDVMELYLETRVPNAADRDTIRAAFLTALDAKRKEGKVPEIKMFDPKAPKEQDRSVRAPEQRQEQERGR
ncbi:LPD7 domain-containing protein [Methylovirgula sp. 4M-Z18]|uniref:LPD7 domain-containing protein n=1 Tax=Methylovirgula sp. 4M-Z18 TaxID=2293567 RepID=UPI000E2F46DF|nr:LPD7 domain-containing protein [Methylovirgula sp. 4M-Z18]RFB76678.1 hypothetical protein DYH55_19675 [Methylovirgula sp. 4M-Z18]